MKIIFSLVMLMSMSAFADEPVNSYVFDDGSYACYAPSNEGLNHMRSQVSYSADFSPSAQVSCQTISGLRNFFNYTAVAMAGSGLYLSCTAIGTPIAVNLEAAALGAQTISLLLGHINCRDLVTEQLIEKQVKAQTCQILNMNGVHCDPNQIQFNQ